MFASAETAVNHGRGAITIRSCSAMSPAMTPHQQKVEFDMTTIRANASSARSRDTSSGIVGADRASTPSPLSQGIASSTKKGSSLITHASVDDSRKKAAAEDKPIVICYTGGAGYNEPLGVC